jgi:hypothetical protein
LTVKQEQEAKTRQLWEAQSTKMRKERVKLRRDIKGE